MGFSCGSAGKESTCHAGDLGLIPGLGRSPAEGKGYPLQYTGLEKSTDCTVHGVAKSRTRLSDFLTFASFVHLFPTYKNCERREAKSKGEKERYKHLNAEFQRIARRDKKAFFSYQCKEIRGEQQNGKD